jgi:addiction module HigA family antidote
MSKMHNPAHPGAVLREWIPAQMSVTQAALALKINRVTLSNLLNGRGNITPNIALRLAAWLGTSAEMWINMQVQFDLWIARQQRRPTIKPLAREAAHA